MSFDVEQHVRYKIANAPVQRFPFAHFYIRDVFPEDYYRALLAHLPPTEAYTPISETGSVSAGAYESRFVLDLEEIAEIDVASGPDAPWPPLQDWMMNESFARFMVGKFRPAIEERFGAGSQLSLTTDCRLVRDFTRYAIKPHTDTETKLVSLLFYMPKDASMSHLGTSIYAPSDPEFRSDGSKHFSSAGFRQMARMEYQPNSLFGFVRTDFSFHGVERITDPEVERNLVLYNIYVPRVTVPPRKPKASADT